MRTRWHSAKKSVAKVLRDRPWVAFDNVNLLKKKKKTNKQKPKKR